MLLTKMLDKFGDYCMFMWRVIAIPDKWKVFFKRYLNEIYKLGIDSIPLIIIVSLFIGSLCTILIKLNISNPLLPRNAAWGASFPSERALPAGGFGSVHTPSP